MRTQVQTVMLNSHCNNNNKNIEKKNKTKQKNMRPAAREHTIHVLKDQRPTFYATEFNGVK